MSISMHISGKLCLFCYKGKIYSDSSALGS